jgi:hypothetical protein
MNQTTTIKDEYKRQVMVLPATKVLKLTSGKGQDAFAHRYDTCVTCDVYKSAASNPIFQIGEQFN